MKITRKIVLTLLILILAGGSVYAGTERILAQGDGVIVTGTDVQAMKKTIKNSMQPTPKALVEGTLRIKLFAQEARRLGIACPAAVDKRGFERDLALSSCYLKTQQDALTTSEKAIESYYRVYWRRFVNKENGELRYLDAELRKKISERILSAKKMNFGLQEYKKLCEKYHIVFTAAGS